MSSYIPIAGTFAWADDTLEKVGPERRWWQYNSNFDHYMGECLFTNDNTHDPFTWSTDLNGIQFWRRWPILQKWFKKDKDHRDWMAAGSALTWYVEAKKIDLKDRNIIAHSHAYQVIAYACAYHGLKINNLITVSSPIRRDMEPVYTLAKFNINRHLHIYDGGTFSDRVQVYGEFGDGGFFPLRYSSHADFNDPIGNVQHSKVLSNPDDFHYWSDRGWLDFLKTGNLRLNPPEIIIKENKNMK